MTFNASATKSHRLHRLRKPCASAALFSFISSHLLRQRLLASSLVLFKFIKSTSLWFVVLLFFVLLCLLFFFGLFLVLLVFHFFFFLLAALGQLDGLRKGPNSVSFAVLSSDDSIRQVLTWNDLSKAGSARKQQSLPLRFSVLPAAQWIFSCSDAHFG